MTILGKIVLRTIPSLLIIAGYIATSNFINDPFLNEHKLLGPTILFTGILGFIFGKYPMSVLSAKRSKLPEILRRHRMLIDSLFVRRSLCVLLSVVPCLLLVYFYFAIWKDDAGILSSVFTMYDGTSRYGGIQVMSTIMKIVMVIFAVAPFIILNVWAGKKLRNLILKHNVENSWRRIYVTSNIDDLAIVAKDTLPPNMLEGDQVNYWSSDWEKVYEHFSFNDGFIGVFVCIGLTILFCGYCFG